MKKYIVCLTLSFVLMLTSGCFQQTEQGQDTKKTFQPGQKIQVTATTGMIADAVSNVGGEQVDVKSLMGPGVDPHLYKASSGDIAKLEQADIIFYNGLHLEGKMGEIFESMARQKMTVAISRDIPEESLLGWNAASGGGAHDPHIWFDIELWIEAVKIIQKSLAEIMPEKAEVFMKNAQNYIKELENLHAWAKSQMATIPPERRLLITSHDAFGYFGRAYEAEVMGIQGISTASDYGLKDLERVIDIIVDRKIKAIFVETSVPKKSIEAVQAGVKSKGFNVEIGGVLFGDAMGDPDTSEGNYLGMIRYNVKTIVDALQ